MYCVEMIFNEISILKINKIDGKIKIECDRNQKIYKNLNDD